MAALLEIASKATNEFHELSLATSGDQDE